MSLELNYKLVSLSCRTEVSADKCIYELIDESVAFILRQKSAKFK